MGEASHTPGPWRTFTCPTRIEILCNDRLAPIYMPSAGIRVADIRFRRIGRGGSFSGNTADEANARLIAAAPDMLDALKGQLQRLERRKPPGFVSVQQWAETCLATPSASAAVAADAEATLALIAVIAKATGGTMTAPTPVKG